MTVGDGDKRPASKERTGGERKGSFKGAIDKAREAVGMGKKDKKGEEAGKEKGDESAVA